MESLKPILYHQASELTRESYPMLVEISGYQMAVTDPPPRESFTTSRPLRNSTA